MKHEPLLNEIRNAFPPLPIVAAGAFTQRGIAYCDGMEYMREIDGKSWEQIDAQYIARRSDALDFLGDAHLVALLPAYLHLLLVFKPTSPVPETMLPLMTKPEPTDEPTKLFGWATRRFQGMTDRLSDLQRNVVAKTLQRFIELHPAARQPAQRALARYWQAFLDH